ncbi:hypothetical protein Daus18300_009788 [Diaporthe australafricana]|uniref:Uncharacterized protein n=1 Tax=Diaporthe australafricana TaxID=127596 RepID=A0ABR3WCU8_9PEZI
MKSRWRPTLPLLLVALAPGLLPIAAQASSSQSTVSVYVPGYDAQNWEDLAGSVITSLASTTAATCTEYSSFGSDFKENNITGPTETTRTVTYSGTEVQWGTLVMATPAPASNPASPTVDPDGGYDPSDTAWYFPSPTSTSWSDERPNPRSALVLSVTALAATFML